MSSLVLLFKIKQSKNKIIDNRQTISKNTTEYVSTVIIKDITFVALNLPISLTIFINSYRFTINGVDDDYRAWIVNLVYEFSNKLLYLNYSINFFVHFFMNKYFKRKLLKILRIKYK